MYNFQHLLFSTGPTNPGELWIWSQRVEGAANHHVTQAVSWIVQTCNLLRFHDLSWSIGFKTYAKIPKLAWSNMPPTSISTKHVPQKKKTCRMLLGPLVGNAGEGVFHVQPGINKVSTKRNDPSFWRKIVIPVVVGPFGETLKPVRTCFSSNLYSFFFQIHILSCCKSMLEVWCSHKIFGWHFRALQTPNKEND